MQLQEHQPFFEIALQQLERLVAQVRAEATHYDPVEHVKTRIKNEASIVDKLKRKGLAPTTDNALNELFDLVGMRVICTFIDDIYTMATALREMPGVEVLVEKDYVARPKESGYRSYHMILCVPATVAGETRLVQCEIQLRTIAMDFWASLEHQLHYKHAIEHEKLISCELKLCADEIAATDLRLQTLRDLLTHPIEEV